MGLDPDNVFGNYLAMTSGGTGTHSIAVSSTDPGYHIATWYYLTIKSTLGSSSVTASIMQVKSVDLLPNGYIQKFSFESRNTLVKNLIFPVNVENN